IDPDTPWMARRTKDLIDNFETVLAARWPSVQDYRLTKPLRYLLRTLGSWRYDLRIYKYPVELRWAQRAIDLRKPKFESV
ncbi:MAG: B12-binding domain-containing radical SAM protein, partial [Terriglobales bacterium]